jgi:hypothetical protein
MKVGRSILIGLVVFVVVVGVALFFLWSSLDKIVAAAIEKYGSEVTETKVQVSSVSIKLGSGEGAVSGLRIGNPTGFSTPNAFSLGNISIKIDTGSITGDPVVIDEIIVTSPSVYFEINEKGSANITTIKNNIQKGEKGSSKKATEEKAGEKSVNLLIRKLVIEDGKIDVRVAALQDKPMSTKLPRIKMTNIGSGSGASPREIAEQVLAVLVSKVGPAVAGLGIDKYIGKGIDEIKKVQEEVEKKVRGEVDKKLGESLDDTTKSAGEAVKKLFGK